MRKLLQLYDSFGDYYEENKKKVVVYGVLIISLLILLIAIISSIMNYNYQKELEQLKKERYNISKVSESESSNDDDLKEILGDLYDDKVDSKLTDIGVENMYTQDEITVHANLFLNIVNEETRQKASTELPIVEKARKGILKDTSGYKEIFNVDNTIKFIGIDYAENSKNYTASIVADRKGTLADGSPVSSQINLIIYYANSKINNWEWKEK